MELIKSQQLFTEQNGSEEESPRFFHYSDSPYLNTGLNIVTWFFLSIGLLDFTLQSGIILASFISSLCQSMKSSRRIFGILIVLIFIFVRLNMAMVILAPIIIEWMSGTWVNASVTYVSLIATTIVYVPGIIFALVYIARYGVSAKKADSRVMPGEEPMIAILMPIYNEPPQVLFRAIDSMFDVEYPASRKHLFLSFDDPEESELYFEVLAKLGILTPEKYASIMEAEMNNNSKPTEFKFPARIDVTFGGMVVTICRFPHGGKNSAQGHGFRLVQRLYSKTKESTYILSIDSDIILHPHALHNFVAYAQSHPNFMAATGLLTCSTQFNVNIYQYMQNAEYVDSQVFMRAAEAGLGAVTCLPGAMTFVKMDSFLDVSQAYFYGTKEESGMSSFQYHREAFGEDRYLTYLLIKSGTKPYQVAFVPNAVCKTDAPATFMTLLKQRRRWVLGAMACETYQLTSPIIWRRFPLLQIYKMFIYESRSLDWLAWILFLSLISLESWSELEQNWVLLLFPLMILLKYLILSGYCLFSRRKKLCFYYILLILLMPLFTLITVIYSACTWNVRRWGGPRGEGSKDQTMKLEILSKVMDARSKTAKEDINMNVV